MLRWVLCFCFFSSMCVCVHIYARLGVDCISSKGDSGHCEAGISAIALFGRLDLWVFSFL